ncbi:MAG TPA: hypothetical protein VIB79_22185 [Candidatus Binatia bacterium]
MIYRNYSSFLARMTADLQALFANLTEQERVKGHHSPEGRAIRTLSRAISGWLNSQLNGNDILALCSQAIEDWLRAKLKLSPWSRVSRPELIAAAADKKLISVMDAVRLQRIRNARSRTAEAENVSDRDVEEALFFCIRLVEQHW